MNYPARRLGARMKDRPLHARDDTTRYLCAAAHLDSQYANQAIREFLVEKTRPVPPSPGVNAAVVLGEAIAARTRRKLRDGALAVLLISFVFAAPADLFLGWIVLAVVVAMVAAVVGSMTGKRPELRSKAPTSLLAVGGLLLIVVLLFTSILDLLSPTLSVTTREPSYNYSYDYPPTDSGPSLWTVVSFVLIGLILAVLLTDRLVVWKLLVERFRRTPTTRIAAPRIHDREIYKLSPSRFLNQLLRFTNPKFTMASAEPGSPPSNGNGAPADAAPMIVYRGFSPFVGAGMAHRPWSIAVPLEVLPGVSAPKQLTTAALYDAIRAEIDGLHQSTGLTPGRRLGALEINEQVIVCAEELIDHLAEPEARDFLEDTDVPPYTVLRGDRVRAIRADPLEWARYYLCFQIETWDRDFVVSVFLHVAVDAGTLYVEWTPCLVLPIKKGYQRIDTMSRSPALPIGQSLLELIKLPATMPRRLWHTLSLIRPLPQDRGVISPDMYGGLRSLREMAADSSVHNYFQLADRDRYLKMLESRFVLAVSRIMRRSGYSAASFDQQAATVVSNHVSIGGSVAGNVVLGSGNKVGDVSTGGPANPQPQQPQPKG